MVAYRYARNIAGWPAGMLLVMPDLVTRHGARTADPDMLFIACVSGAMLCLSLQRARETAFAFSLLGVAFLTKSFHVLPYGLVAALFTLVTAAGGQLDWRHALALPVFFFLPVLPWAAARYLADGTRFFHVMPYYDLLARTGKVLEAHYAPPLFYVSALTSATAPVLLALLICSCRRGVWHWLCDPRVQLLALWLALPLTLYSLASSKLYWYSYPQQVPLVLLIATGVVSAMRSNLHRVAGAVVVVLTLFNGVFNESHILQAIDSYVPALNPVGAAIQRIGETHAPSLRIPVYINPAPDLVRQQDWVATADLVGNVVLMAGGEAAFRQSTRPDAILLNAQGQWHQRQ